MQIKINDNLTENIKDISVSTGGGVFNLSELNTYLLNLLYPIGSMYLSVNSTNPSTFFGGTWEAFGQGRTLVGVDTSQSEFNSVLKTGGSKYLQEHSHNTYYADYPITPAAGYGTATNFDGNNGSPVYTKGVRDITTGNSGNLQPYITVYMWKRIS